MTPFLSIITPIYNSAKTIKPYLEAVFNSQYQDFELIIVDGLSDDPSQQICNGYKVKYEQIGRKCESDQKRNRGVEIASAEWVLFLDSDIVIPTTALGDIVDVLKNHPEIAGLIGSYDDAPGSEKIISQFKFLFHHFIHQQEGVYIDSFWSGCGAIKKSVFKSLGGFNAPYLHGSSIHDIELGYRLKKNKYKIYDAKHIQVKHLKELDFWEWIYTDICVRGVPWIIIMLMYRDLSPKLNTSHYGVMSVLCVWAMILLSIGSFHNSILIGWAALIFILFLGFNWPLLKFFASKKGFLFSCISALYLFIYYFNCGICVLAGPFYYLAAKKSENHYHA